MRQATEDVINGRARRCNITDHTYIALANSHRKNAVSSTGECDKKKTETIESPYNFFFHEIFRLNTFSTKTFCTKRIVTADFPDCVKGGKIHYKLLSPYQRRKLKMTCGRNGRVPTPAVPSTTSLYCFIKTTSSARK
jgi:hypothetical protein